MPRIGPTDGSWKPGQSGNPRGTSLISEAARAIRMSSREHIHELYWQMLNMNCAQVTQKLLDPDINIVEACIIKAILHDMEEGSTKTIESMMNRVIGKPKETHEIMGKMTIEDIVSASYKSIGAEKKSE